MWARLRDSHPGTRVRFTQPSPSILRAFSVPDQSGESNAQLTFRCSVLRLALGLSLPPAGKGASIYEVCSREVAEKPTKYKRLREFYDLNQLLNADKEGGG